MGGEECFIGISLYLIWIACDMVNVFWLFSHI